MITKEYLDRFKEHITTKEQYINFMIEVIPLELKNIVEQSYISLVEDNIHFGQYKPDFQKLFSNYKIEVKDTVYYTLTLENPPEG